MPSISKWPKGAPVVGRQAMREGFAYFFRAFPDNCTTLTSRLVDGEWVSWRGGGTWRGEFAGHLGNGRFFQVVAGKIKLQRGYWGEATWFKQLGLPLE
jgi:SnoaL-like polyketide cyclase